MTRNEWVDMIAHLLNETFPKGQCAERGQAIVMLAKLTFSLELSGMISRKTVDQILDDRHD